MKGKTHMMLGVAGATTILAKYPIESGIILLGSSILGSLIPDIDHPKSKINQRILPIKNKFFKIVIYSLIGIILIFAGQETKNIFLKLSGVISIIVGISHHRSFTHSLLGCFLFSIIFYLVTKKYSLESAYIGFVLGYGLHLVTDFVTNDGIELFYPYKKRIRAPITVKTGGIVEYILIIFSGIYFACNFANYF